MQRQHNPSPHPDGNETRYNDEFIDDFEWVKEKQNSKTTEVENDGSICTKIKEMLMRKHQKPGNHVLNFMVCLKFAVCIFYVLSYQIKHDSLKLLKHPLVKRWIKQKWKRARIIYATFFILYLVFLAILTAYAVVSPIPALDSSTCKLDYY